MGRSSRSCPRTVPRARSSGSAMIERGAKASERSDADERREGRVRGLRGQVRDDAVGEVHDDFQSRRSQHRGPPVGVGTQVTADRDRVHGAVAVRRVE